MTTRIFPLSALPFLVLACVDTDQPAEIPSPAREVVASPHADIVLTNGTIYTANDDQPWADAVAIKNGKFIYVGDNAGAEALAGDTTRAHDLAGRLAIQGLIDSHTHPGLVSMMGPGEAEPIIPTTSHEDIMAWLKQYARAHWYSPVIMAEAWPVSLYGIEGPNKEDLGEIVSIRPVMLFDDSGHSFWVNSSMLRLMGVDKDTPGPVPGLSYFVRDENGEPTGWIKEFAALRFLGDSSLAEDDEREKALADFLNFLSRKGVTTLYDAGNLLWDDGVYRVVAKLEREGRLPVRYEGTYHIAFPDQVPEAVDEIERLREEYGGELLRFNTVKIHLDGVGEIRTAAYLEPYLDDPDNSGNTLLTQDELTAFILKLEDAKLDLHIHAVGDRTTRVALDAFEAARTQAGGQLRLRLTVSHLELVAESDPDRFEELGVIANFTPHWFGGYFQGARPALGEQRWNNRERPRTLLDHGARVTFSSDVTTYGEMPRSNPFYGMQIGHNRQDIGEEDGPIRPPEDERLSLEALLRGYTIDAAYQLRMEDVVGSIETGKAADLVVLGENLFDKDRTAIHTVEPRAVFRSGELTSGSL